MTAAPTEIPGPSFPEGLRFLRTQALSAHDAGDGFAVNHVCRLALTVLGQRLGPSSVSPVAGLTLADIRWVFSLWLYWLVDHDLAQAERGRPLLAGFAERLAGPLETDHDFTLLSFLFVAIADPLVPLDINPLVAIPPEWLQSRSQETEDISAFSLAVEFAWYANPSGEAWRRLVATWRDRCLPTLDWPEHWRGLSVGSRRKRSFVWSDNKGD